MVNMRLSVVIPCYNEEATLSAILQAVREAPYPDKEVIVVDDFSRDRSRELLQGELEIDKPLFPSNSFILIFRHVLLI